MFLRLLLLIACTVLGAGCGSFSAPKKDTFYRLGDAVTAPNTAVSGALVHVPPFQTTGLLNERALVYAHADGTALEQYGYHFWVDSPRLLLQQAMIDALAAGPAVRATREPDYRADYLLNGRLRRFERAGKDGAATAELALELELRRGRPAEVLLVRSYTRSLPLADDTPAACAAALATASHEVLREFAGEAQALIEK